MSVLLLGIRAMTVDDLDWFSFDPSVESFPESAIDLCSLNEKFAGEQGVISVGFDEFVHSASSQPVHFWAVKPGFWRQPWALLVPSQAGQFPAATLRFRRGFAQAGKVLARIDLNPYDGLNL